MQNSLATTLDGTLRLSDTTGRRTAGRFSVLITENAAVFQRYFGVALFAGSLNIDVPNPKTLQTDLDAGKPPPAIVIPKAELVNMPAYIGDGQAWPCLLHADKVSKAIACWIFRRKGSRVPPGVIEIVAPAALRQPYNLAHGDKVRIEVFTPQSVPPSAET